MLSRKNIFAIGQLFVLFIIGVYIESVSGKSLLFTEDILAESLRAAIIKHYVIVLMILGLFNLTFYYFSHSNLETREKRKFYNDLCLLFFNKLVKENSQFSNQNFKVSLFIKQKGIILNKKRYLLPQYRNYLINHGRHQTRQEMTYCKIKFLPGEGIVGNCYSFNEILFEDTIQYSLSNHEEYVKQHSEKLGLPKYKIKLLKDKCCSFVCVPVKYFQKDEIFGILIIDSLIPTDFKNNFRVIENTISDFSVFFSK